MKKYLCLAIAFMATVLFAQTLPLTKLSLYSSGVALFEHSGYISGNGKITLEIPTNAVNDALKSLVIIDEEQSSKDKSDERENFLIEYTSASSESAALESLDVNIGGNPSLANLFLQLTGEKIIIKTPAVIEGRIISVEAFNETEHKENFRLLIASEDGIKTILLSEINSFEFENSEISKAITKGLNILQEDKSRNTKNFAINLPGKKTRKVKILYIAPAPVWKTSYRLEFSNNEALFQAWAIVDNASSLDWQSVELSLVIGKPVSFIQNLYDPYFVQRKILMPNIAGAADARTYSPSFAEESLFYGKKESMQYLDEVPAVNRMQATQKASLLGASPQASATVQTSGEQFFFTVKNPVTIKAQNSVLLPLANTKLKADRVTVIGKNPNSYQIDAMLCAELNNNTEINLPAGAITVYDENIYAGDALIEYFPQNDKKYIAFGEDQNINTIVNDKNLVEEKSIRISKGVMYLTKANIFEKHYTVKNLSSINKSIVIEHDSRYGASLKVPTKADEKIDGGYRFKLELTANEQKTFVVKEEQTLQERISLVTANEQTLLAYSSSGVASKEVKNALSKAVAFKEVVANAQIELKNARAEREELLKTQERLRLNLEAFGRETVQGSQYLQKLLESDKEIENVDKKIVDLTKKHLGAEKIYMDYIANLNL